MPQPSLSRPRRLLVLATDNRPARAYLAVVGLSVVAMFVVPESPVAASPLILTAPLSFLGVVLPFGPGTEGPTQALAVGFWAVWLLLCALVNAAVVGALVERSATSTAPRKAAQASPARARALLAPAVDNWLARGYLALVAAALTFFLYAAYVSPDPGFAAIWPVMATAPLGMLAFFVSIPAEFTSLAWLNPLLFTAATALCGLGNAVLLGRLAHRLQTRDLHPAT
ncbi:SCO4225 family membrane protein [Streptomyces sp. NPDC101776]|uniref:SCO4225 family membrane protein n=1 Tax=Streptomyces sp. NPDC101776 TaxID=3366146 RepID=UPI0037FD164F